MRADLLKWLERWYSSQCDGDWEHQFGIKIESLDNPGWAVTIDLADTELEGRVFEKEKRGEDTDRWSICEIRDNQFLANCGPNDLETVLETFRSWVTKIRLISN